MNILITNFHQKDGGGHTTYIKSIFRSKSNFNFYVASPKTSRLYSDIKTTHPEKIFELEFPAKLRELSGIIKAIFRLKNLVGEYNINIIHANGSPDHKIAMLTKLLFHLRVKVLRTKHDSFEIKNNFFTNILYKKFTEKVVVVSNFQLKKTIPKNILEKTILIQNGVNVDYFAPQKKSLRLMKKLGINKDTLILVSNAGTGLHKGWQFIVEAVSMLEEKQKSSIKILLIGNLINELDFANYIGKFKMEKNVIFSGFQNDVRDYLALGDIGFVLSHNVETISFACREMMSMGKPMIVSNYAGLPENITPGKDGWVVEVGNVMKIFSLLNSIDYKNLAKFSKHARSKSLSIFSERIFLKKTMAVYRSILSA